jgi:hypothetical protein
MALIKPRLGGLFLITLFAAATQAQQPVVVPPTHPDGTYDPGTHMWFPSRKPLPGETIPLPVQIFHPRHSVCFQASRGNPVVVSQHAAEPRSAADRASV